MFTYRDLSNNKVFKDLKLYKNDILEVCMFFLVVDDVDNNFFVFYLKRGLM